MTWFRVGGGSGISAALKNRMNSVLNKKFGTAVDYPPEGWPDDVNLMGVLPEATASGSIATLEDGADDVPTKSLIVTIPPTLSDVSVLTEKQTGKTVFYPMDIEQGSISGSGYNSDSIYRIRTAERKAVTPSTQYKIKVNSEVQIYEVHEYTDLTGSSTHLVVNASEYTFTTKSTTNYLKILFRYSNNTTITPSAITELQVTDGALYWKTYSANLGRTIHGGTADLVNGVCEPINWLPTVATSKTQNGITWTVNTDGTVTLENTATARTYLYVHNYFKILPHDATITVNVEGLYDNGANDVFVNISYSNDGTTYGGTYGQCTWSNPTKQIDYTADKYIGFYIDCPSGATTNQTVKITVSIGTTAYTYSPYFEPFSFDGQEINTLYGVNNFWNDAGGDTTVVYRRDIDLVLQAVSGSRGLMVTRPAIEPSNGDQGSEKSTENNIETEGEQDAR